MFKKVLNREEDANLLEKNPQLIEVEEKLNQAKTKMNLQGPTSQLWLQYINMMNILKSNIRGDRTGASYLPKPQNLIVFSYFPLNLLFTGDYQLHLETVQAMHPFFAASGLNNYTKSTQVYLQDMENLSKSNSDVHQFFSEGNFVTRRSNRYWSGLPDDLLIEQVKWRHV